MVTTLNTASYAFVAEQNNPFLELFPHRYDFIWAQRPAPGHRPNWQTESRYPLSDRRILQGQYLYGVRFGSQTQYLMIDVDASSPYHPKRDRLAVSNLVAALEPLGLVSFLACTSSYSGGLHLYFPFEVPQKSWDLAFAVQVLLQQSGFQVAPGILELFPNPKLYVGEGTPNLYAAHRLPLQEPGSYLLTNDWSPRFTSQQEFVRAWKQIALRNDLHSKTLETIVDQARCFQKGLSRSASKFLEDLNTEIEQGWTGHGQTNRLLGRIAMRSYIFGHLLNGLSLPLEGLDLVQDIVRVARQLPGYQDWCRHQHEIESRAEEWARCAENSHYFPYGYGNNQRSTKFAIDHLDQATAKASWNQQQESEARTRIARAIAALLASDQLPVKTTARFHALVKEGIGGGTLYRHRDLWHPCYLQNQLALESTAVTENEAITEISTEKLDLQTSEHQNFEFSSSSKVGSQSLEDYDPTLKSLLPTNDRNAFVEEPFSDRRDCFLQAGGNREDHPMMVNDRPAPQSLRNQRERSQFLVEHRQRMQRYLASGDAILVAEAQAWFAQLEGAQRLSEPSDMACTKGDGELTSNSFGIRAEALLEKHPSKGVDAPSGKRLITHREQFQVVVEAIAYHLARLQWPEPTLRQNLLACTGKPVQALLTDEELVRWLQCLELTE